MRSRSDTPLLRRLPPSLLLRLELPTEGGGVDIREFKLCFDLNAAAAIKERSGVSLLNFVDAWSKISDPCLLRVMFWASVLAHHPEYDSRDEETGKRTEDGLETIGSWVDETNTDAILEALWDAYLKSLSKTKRDAVVNLRKMAEEAQKEKEKSPSPLTTPTPSQSATATTTTTGSSSGPSLSGSESTEKSSAA